MLSLFGVRSILHRHARVFCPLMFMAHDPQIPSLQDLLKVSVGSTSFFILINASRTCVGVGRFSGTKGKQSLPWAHIGSSRLCTTVVWEEWQVHLDSVSEGQALAAPGRIGTYPAVDLELLWVGRLLCGDGLRTGRRRCERPDTTDSKEGGGGLGDGLHGRRTR